MGVFYTVQAFIRKGYRLDHFFFKPPANYPSNTSVKSRNVI